MHLTSDQIVGARFLAARRIALLADVPGLGKTAQLIRAVDVVGATNVVVICPAIVRENIAREFSLWSQWGHDVTVIASGSDAIPDKGAVITSYALASTDKVHVQLMSRRCDVLICDEAHAIKNRDAERTKRVLALAALARHTWLATGTPMPNHSEELFVFLKMSGDWTGTHKEFVNRFCIVRDTLYGQQICGSKSPELLRSLLAKNSIRRTTVEGRPALTVDVAALPTATGGDPFASLDDATRDALTAAVTAGDFAFADTPALATVCRFVGLVKARPVAALVRAELDGGRDRIIVFAKHRDVIASISEHIGRCAETITGSTSAAARQRTIDAFQRPDNTPRVIVAQIHAAGEGINLTRASRVIIAEPSWVPKDNDQALARAWRRGQNSPVHVSFCSLAGSIDEQIARTLARKSRDVASVV